MGVYIGMISIFPGSTLVFDCFSELTARKIGSHPALKKMQVHVYWGLDDPHELSTWNKSITFKYFYPGANNNMRARIFFFTSHVINYIRQALWPS
ncbi:MAG: hypothetical protein JXJ04_11575 [Spirochaetales bacterium]|nr:hypothetical protein [Spirochaetales bacterium]